MRIDVSANLSFLRAWLGSWVVLAVLFAGAAAPAPGCVGNRHPLQSHDILDREQQTQRAFVKHILIGWDELEKNYSYRMDQRAKLRHEGDANDLVKLILGKLQAGTAIEALMIEYSEDPGSKTGRGYPVTPEDSKDPAFRRLCLRLRVGEIGVVRTRFGWHIVKRIT